MQISPIGYTSYIYPSAAVHTSGQAVDPVRRPGSVTPVGEKGSLNIGKVKSSECQTCKSRKYVDQSSDNNVSFKSPAHVSPQASFAAVASHEQEHVANAEAKGNQPGNELVSAYVTYKTQICPECGTPYIAGGTTYTKIQYNESNPYEASRKSMEEGLIKGMNVDYVA
jgi:hypothetical protein